MITFEIYIEPHERHEALDYYGDWLTHEQIEEIKNAPDGAAIKLHKHSDGPTHVTVMEP